MNPLNLLGILLLSTTLSGPVRLAGEAAPSGEAPAAVAFQEHEEAADIKLPSGKSQREEILKQDYQKAIEEAGKLVKLAEDLKAELEREDAHVLSLASLKKTEEIEKLARKIRGRLRRQ